MMTWRYLIRQRLGAAATAVLLAWGCAQDQAKLSYLGEPDHSYYKDRATEVNFPVTESYTESTIVSNAPRTVRDLEETEPTDITLAECLQTSLQNSQIIRTAGTFLSPGNALYSAPDRVTSVYDPALQESGVLFGNRGVEAALSAFDAQFTTSMLWGHNSTIQNNAFFGGGLAPGSALTTDTGAFQAGLQKTFANGGTVSLGHNVNYLGSNAPGQLFPTSYAGNVNVQYQLPLLAGSGTEFTRIAGPIGQQFGGLTGVSQGVIISRINGDIAIADFEAAVTNLAKDVEDTYWDLYLAYRRYDTAANAFREVQEAWRIENEKFKAGGGEIFGESQARDQYFASEANLDTALSNILSSEIRLRRLMGLPVNDGGILRPVDTPVSAELIPDWNSSMTQALTHRVELRRQKWNIKSLELQLKAARSLTRPRLDLLSGYQVNGFGDHLFANGDADAAGTAQGLNNFYETIAQGDQSGWNLGVQMTMPIGFRSAHAQVRNYELRLAKAQLVLGEQEQEISHELAVSFQDLARAHKNSDANLHRVYASRENTRIQSDRVDGGKGTADEKLRAISRKADAELAYHISLVDYNKALTNLQYRKGVLLEHNGIYLAEGGWTPPAYIDSDRNAEARAYGVPNPYLGAQPEPFASSAPVDGVFVSNSPYEVPPTSPEASELPVAPEPIDGE